MVKVLNRIVENKEYMPEYNAFFKIFKAMTLYLF